MRPVQSRMARAAVGWGTRDLARMAQVSPDTVARLERGEALKPSTIAMMRTAFEEAGIEFAEGEGWFSLTVRTIVLPSGEDHEKADLCAPPS